MTESTDDHWHSGVSPGSRITPSLDVLFQQVDDQAVLVDLASEKFFGLNRVGARLWELLSGDPALAPAYSTLLDEFDVQPDVLSADVSSLVASLREAGLVELQ